mmetsp:Transcript_31053/g.64798  ORF Transcript_31053/g.64798 Transcript_31053/m.64798 type:complete len:99 (+) Transcript_31053:1032-1328(+)
MQQIRFHEVNTSFYLEHNLHRRDRACFIIAVGAALLKPDHNSSIAHAYRRVSISLLQLKEASMPSTCFNSFHNTGFPNAPSNPDGGKTTEVSSKLEGN